MEPSEYMVRALGESAWPAFAALVERENGIFGGCWCMGFHPDAQRIPRELRYVSGATTVESSIDDLLAGGAGVCQDFTHLFLAMVRGAGWPARYVSGYPGPVNEEGVVEGQSHAWVEVCGSDGRWVGLDPTLGEHVGAHHLRLAVGRDYGDVAPHHRLFFGAATGAPPEVSVRVARMSSQQVGRVEYHAAVHWQQQQQQQ